MLVFLESPSNDEPEKFAVVNGLFRGPRFLNGKQRLIFLEISRKMVFHVRNENDGSTLAFRQK